MTYVADPTLIYINIVFTIAAIILILRIGRRTYRGSKNNLDLPRCAKCRYALVNVTSPTCSECGVNIATTGVIAPGKRGLPSVKAFILFTVVCIALFVCAIHFFPFSLIDATAGSQTRLISLNADVTKFDKVDFEADGDAIRFIAGDATYRMPHIPLKSTRLVVHVVGHGEIAFEVTNQKFRTSANSALRPYDESEIRSSLFAAANAPLDANADKESQELATLFTELVTSSDAHSLLSLQNSPNASRWTSTGTVGSAKITYWTSLQILYPIFLILWTLGILKILPRKRDVVFDISARNLTAAPAPTAVE